MRKLYSPIALVVFTGCLFGQSSDGFPGTWKLDLNKSSRPQGFAGQGSTVTIHAMQNGLHFKHEWTEANGKNHLEEFSCIFDGKPHSWDKGADATHRTHTILCRRLDDRTIEITTDHDEGAVVTKNRRILAPDNLTMQYIFYGTGDQVIMTAVYDRQ